MKLHEHNKVTAIAIIAVALIIFARNGTPDYSAGGGHISCLPPPIAPSDIWENQLAALEYIHRRDGEWKLGSVAINAAAELGCEIDPLDPEPGIRCALERLVPLTYPMNLETGEVSPHEVYRLWTAFRTRGLVGCREIREAYEFDIAMRRFTEHRLSRP